MTRYRAVLFDWRCTLAHYAEPAWWVERALQAAGRPAGRDEIAAMVRSVDQAAALPDVIEGRLHEDSSPEYHRSTTMRWFERAGLDAELAEALYDLDFDPANHPLYPDVPDVLTAIRGRGVKVALVSNIHFDLRALLHDQGVGDLIDAYVQSFELGFQKPDPRMFELALRAVGAQPHEALMVGDSPETDGGAISVGIPTLLIPMQFEFRPRGLDLVVRMLDT